MTAFLYQRSSTLALQRAAVARGPPRVGAKTTGWSAGSVTLLDLPYQEDVLQAGLWSFIRRRPMACSPKPTLAVKFSVMPRSGPQPAHGALGSISGT
jgi:hypothetical protein